jgi:hypothetical protein
VLCHMERMTQVNSRTDDYLGPVSLYQLVYTA